MTVVQEQDRVARAQVLAAAIAPELEELESWFQSQRSKARANPRQTLQVLEETETRLLKLLEAPELGPLRDLVQVELEEARTLAERAAAGKSSGIMTASTRWAQGSSAGFLARAWRQASSLLEILGDRAGNDDLLVDLCIVSDPTGASVRLFPRLGEEELTRETRTVAVLGSVWRGRYSYRIELEDRRPAQCLWPCGLDLLHPDEPALLCELDAAGSPTNDVVPCQERDGHPAACESVSG